MLSFCRSLKREVSEPVSPGLKERSLKQHKVSTSGKTKKQMFMFCVHRKETDKDLSSDSSPMSPLSLPLRPIVDKPLNRKDLLAQYVIKMKQA